MSLDLSDTTHRVSSLGRLFQMAAIIEAITWTGLLAGMFLKYVTESTERGVEIFGPIHGMAFIGYVIVTFFAATNLRWRWWVAAVAIAAAVPPLTTIVAERWISRRGDLVDPTLRQAEAGS